MAGIRDYGRIVIFIFALSLLVLSCAKKSTPPEEEERIPYSQRITYYRDYEYLKRTYFDLGRFGYESDPAFWSLNFKIDTIIDFKVFQAGSPNSLEDKFAKLYIDPDQPAVYPEEFYGSYVREMENENGADYFWEPTQFWIRLEKQHRPIDLLACWMVVSRGGIRDTIGSLTSDTLRLKLLMPPYMNENRATWDYEWKNVYYLGAKQIYYDELEVDILKGFPGDEQNQSNLNHQRDVPYLELLGLDLFNEVGARGPDGRVDRADYLLDLYRGHLCFPNRKPFAPEPDIGYAPGDPDARLADRVPEMYTTVNPSVLQENSRYYLKVTITRREDSCGPDW